jgi:hypothetical protein
VIKKRKWKAKAQNHGIFQFIMSGSKMRNLRLSTVYASPGSAVSTSLLRQTKCSITFVTSIWFSFAAHCLPFCLSYAASHQRIAVTREKELGEEMTRIGVFEFSSFLCFLKEILRQIYMRTRRSVRFIDNAK